MTASKENSGDVSHGKNNTSIYNISFKSEIVPKSLSQNALDMESAPGRILKH